MGSHVRGGNPAGDRAARGRPDLDVGPVSEHEVPGVEDHFEYGEIGLKLRNLLKTNLNYCFFSYALARASRTHARVIREVRYWCGKGTSTRSWASFRGAWVVAGPVIRGCTHEWPDICLGFGPIWMRRACAISRFVRRR